jgi:hypothetical protein
MMNRLVLSTWFSGNGGMVSKGESNATILYTECFDREDVIRLINVINQIFGFQASIISRAGKQNRIYVPDNDYEKLKDVIIPYYLPSLYYKLPDGNNQSYNLEDDVAMDVGIDVDADRVGDPFRYKDANLPTLTLSGWTPLDSMNDILKSWKKQKTWEKFLKTKNENVKIIHYSFSAKQKSIINGSLLGDGHLNRYVSKRTGQVNLSILEAYSAAQQDYLTYIEDNSVDICPIDKLKAGEYKDKRYGKRILYSNEYYSTPVYELSFSGEQFYKQVGDGLLKNMFSIILKNVWTPSALQFGIWMLVT